MNKDAIDLDTILPDKLLAESELDVLLEGRRSFRLMLRQQRASVKRYRTAVEHISDELDLQSQRLAMAKTRCNRLSEVIARLNHQIKVARHE